MGSKEGSSYQIHLPLKVNSSFFLVSSSPLVQSSLDVKICRPKFQNSRGQLGAMSSDTTTESGFSWSAVTMWSHKGSDNNNILLCGSFKTRYWYQARTLISQSAQSHYGGIKCGYSVNKNVAIDSPEQQTFTGRRVAKRASQTGPCPSQSDAEMTCKTHSWCLNWKITRKTQPR